MHKHPSSVVTYPPKPKTRSPRSGGRIEYRRHAVSFRLSKKVSLKQHVCIVNKESVCNASSQEPKEGSSFGLRLNWELLARRDHA